MTRYFHALTALSPSLVALATLSVAISAPSFAQDVIQHIAAEPATAQTASVETGGLVSSADGRASAAGREMLDAGGSAADAAMATMLAQLHWWASALRKARQEVPYGQFAAA